jgi:hypothetical protein
MQQVFYPRTSTPNPDDKFWKHSTMGGLNECILVKPPSTLPNCVGYSWGRWYEIMNSKPALSRRNAEDWWAYVVDSYERGQQPRLGAVVCWRKGEVKNNSDGAGHVAIVEDILEDGSIVTSNSGYLGSTFYMRTIKPPYSIGATYNFQGFIYLPKEYVSANLNVNTTVNVAKEVLDGKWGNGADRKAKLTSAGYNYTEVQNMVNLLLSDKSSNIRYLKSVDEIAKEVLEGKWGNGFVRRVNLIKAGYSYDTVQAKVVQLLYREKNLSSLEEVAKEVISGKWGNGLDRKKALIKAGYNYEEVQKKVNSLLR